MTLLDARGKAWFGPMSVAFFVGVPFLAGALAASNTAQWASLRLQTAETLERIAQIESRIRAQAKRSIPKAGEAADLFLDAKTGSLARAELQQRLVGLVEGAGGRLIEVRSEEVAETSTPRSIVMRISLDIANGGLFDLLVAIETGLPILTVETLNLRPVPGQLPGSAEANPTLRVAMGIRGYQQVSIP